MSDARTSRPKKTLPWHIIVPVIAVLAAAAALAWWVLHDPDPAPLLYPGVDG